MSGDDLHDDEDVEPGTIGVGMGGSCPTCRAPVDLGQEFCLECGSPIRFTPRQKRPSRGAARPAAAAPATPPKKRGSGFPWLPFLVVLALVGGGVAFALVDGGDAGSTKDPATSTEEALPTITSETPPETTSSTSTTTLEDCDPTRPLDGTQPAVVDPSTDPNALGGTGEEIPALGSDGTTSDTSSGFDQDVPSIEPTESADATVTVDQNGNLCPGGDSSTGSTTPPVDPSTGTGSTDGTSTDGSNSTTTSGDWPAGKEGWTVIVAGYPTQERAAQRAADVQEDGYDDAGVLFSSDFTSLCPGIYVVFSGVFDDEDKAGDRLAELSAKPDYAGMYVREVRTSGSAPSGCTSVRN